MSILATTAGPAVPWRRGGCSLSPIAFGHERARVFFTFWPRSIPDQNATHVESSESSDAQDRDVRFPNDPIAFAVVPQMAPPRAVSDHQDVSLVCSAARFNSSGTLPLSMMTSAFGPTSC